MQPQSQFTQSTTQPGRVQDDASTPAAASQLSGPLTALAGSAFVSGISYGILEFLQRSPVRHKHVAGSAAWGPQLAAALAVIMVVSVGWARHRRRSGSGSGPLWLLAPLGTRAAARVARAFGFGSESVQLARLFLALPAAALFLFCFWRAGVQVTGGLDPNFTVNAWGGPSYAGAMICHYLDLFLIAGGAAWLIDRILPASLAAVRGPMTRLG
jgi:hypothetical protein